MLEKLHIMTYNDIIPIASVGVLSPSYSLQTSADSFSFGPLESPLHAVAASVGK